MGNMFHNKYILCFGVILSGYHNVDGGFQTTRLGPHPIWNATYTDQLRRDLLLNYDKFARPAQHYNVTNVKLGMIIRHIELNEFKSTLTVYSWLKMSWKDEKLKWNPTKYGGIQNLNLADHELWQPDIFLYNSATATPVSHYNTHCIVYSDGSVVWVPPTQFSVLCNINMKYWPFDSQTCAMKFASWTYNGDHINIEETNKSDLSVEALVENNEWQIINTSIQRNVTFYECCLEPYPEIIVMIHIKRISPSYKITIVTPSIAIICLTLLSFCLPSSSGEKIIVNGFTIIIICIYMIYFIQKLPAMGNHTPLIVMFYSNCLCMSTLSMMTSIAVVSLSRSRHTKAIPWVIKQHLLGKFGNILGLTPAHRKWSLPTQTLAIGNVRDNRIMDFDDLAPTDEQDIATSVSVNSMLQEEWNLLAAAIDKTCLIIFSVIYMLLIIIYSV